MQHTAASLQNIYQNKICTHNATWANECLVIFRGALQSAEDFPPVDYPQAGLCEELLVFAGNTIKGIQLTSVPQKIISISLD